MTDLADYDAAVTFADGCYGLVLLNAKACEWATYNVLGLPGQPQPMDLIVVDQEDINLLIDSLFVGGVIIYYASEATENLRSHTKQLN